MIEPINIPKYGRERTLRIVASLAGFNLRLLTSCILACQGLERLDGRMHYEHPTDLFFLRYRKVEMPLRIRIEPELENKED